MRHPNPALLRLLLFVGALALLALLLVFFGDILMPLLLGLGIAYLLDPAVSWLAGRGVPRGLGAALIALAAVAVVAAAILFLLPAMVQEIRQLIERWPELQAKVRARLAPLLEDLRRRYPAEFAEAQARLAAALRENLPNVAARLAAWLGGLLANLLGLVLFLLNLVFVPVFAFYLLVDWPQLKRGLVDLVPVPYRAQTLARMGEVNAAVASFLRGQLTIALILAAINASGLLLLGVPFGLVVGLVAGLANMIPYMALVVGLGPALLLCWSEHHSWLHLLGVVAVFGGGNLLEGTVLSPRILSRSVNLHPVVVLLAIIVGGSLFGLLGMLVAVPAAAAIQVFVRHWVAQYKGTEIYRGEATAAREEPTR